MKLSLVPREEILNIWSSVSHFIDMAFKRVPTDRDTADVLADCLSGAQTLWIVFDDEKVIHGAMTLRVFLLKGRGPVLMIETGSGVNIVDKQILDKLCQYAKDIGCVSLRAGGRLGWKKYAKQLGFKTAQTIYEHNLEEGGTDGTR